MKFKHWSLRASPPTINFPMSPNEFCFRMGGEIEQHRMLCAIKLLGKPCDWFGTPGGTVDRAENTYVQRLLFDDVGDVQGQKKHMVRRATDINDRTIPFCVHHRLLGNKKGVNHGENCSRKLWR